MRFFLHYFLGMLVLAFVNFSVTPLFAEELQFSDIGGREDTKAIEFLKEYDVVKGYANNEYKPAKKISRAEFLKILLKTSLAEKKECTKTEIKNIGNIFSDVSQDEWYSEYICTGYKSGFVNGYEDNTFKPENPISLAEAAKIVSLAQDIKITKGEENEEWFSPFFRTLQNEKVLAKEKMRSPSVAISRGDMADMIWRITTGNELLQDEGIQTISSCSNLSQELTKANKRSGNFQRFGRNNKMNLQRGISEALNMLDEAPQAMAKTVTPVMADSIESESATASNDFSTTNIQEKGVDEADIIKNDGSHIFLARGEDIKIVQAYPLDEMRTDSTITVDGMNISELFLDGDTLVALGNRSHHYAGKPVPYQENIVSDEMIRSSSRPYYGGQSGIEARIFDISDRKNPKQIRSVSLDGNLVSSRRVGDILYLVSNNYLLYSDFESDDFRGPFLKNNDEEISLTSSQNKCTGIQYFPNFTSSSLTTVVAVDTQNPNTKIRMKNFLGTGENIYASPKNLYIVRNGSEQIFEDKNGSAKWRWENISKIARVSLDGLNINFEAEGTVPGRVLNQYSMSEFENHFRIATQKGEAWGQEKSENLVTILDENLKKTGEIRNIANGENTKSVRFMGKRGFLVTFKNVDPLFVLDLSPTHPSVLGKLKIPGWSDYLHPIDDNYIIGFGKEVDASIDADKVHSDNAVYYTAVLGMKLAIFDVSDLNNPKEIQKTVIGDRGTESEVLHNPRSLFYDGERKLIGFPIQIQEKDTKENGYETFKTTFSGAQLYSFSIENGFKKIGQISHFPQLSTDYWNENYKISRLVRIGENFYASSKGFISGLSSEFKKEKEVSFLEDIACSKRDNALQCESNNSCKALYSMPDCKEGSFCIQVMKFDKCVEKE